MGGFFIPGDTSGKVTLYPTTNTCIPQLMLAHKKRQEVRRWALLDNAALKCHPVS